MAEGGLHSHLIAQRCTSDLIQNQQKLFQVPGVRGVQEYLHSLTAALPKQLKKKVH